MKTPHPYFKNPEKKTEIVRVGGKCTTIKKWNIANKSVGAEISFVFELENTYSHKVCK